MKIETSKMALLIAVGGVALALSGYYRYFIIYYDISEAFTFVCLGTLIFLFSYVYNWMVQEEKRREKYREEINERLQFVLDRQDAIGKWFLGIEKQSNRSDILGEENFSFEKNSKEVKNEKTKHKRKKKKR